MKPAAAPTPQEYQIAEDYGFTRKDVDDIRAAEGPESPPSDGECPKCWLPKDHEGECDHPSESATQIPEDLKHLYHMPPGARYGKSAVDDIDMLIERIGRTEAERDQIEDALHKVEDLALTLRAERDRALESLQIGVEAFRLLKQHVIEGGGFWCESGGTVDGDIYWTQAKEIVEAVLARPPQPPRRRLEK